MRMATLFVLLMVLTGQRVLLAQCNLPTCIGSTCTYEFYSCYFYTTNACDWCEYECGSCGVYDCLGDESCGAIEHVTICICEG
jgi:hypothetical protein